MSDLGNGVDLMIYSVIIASGLIGCGVGALLFWAFS